MLEQAPDIKRRSPVRYVLLGAFAGLVVGAGVASVIWLFVLHSTRASYQQVLEAQGLGNRLVGDLIGGPEEKTASANVKTAGDEFVEDLTHNRLLAAYRTTTEDYQRRVPRAMFDDMVRKNSEIAQWRQSGSSEAKVRKASGDGKKYEYYCTANHVSHDNLQTKRLNFSLTFVPENGVWRITDLEIQTDERK